MATIGIVLLIACANVANLMLVRTEGRAQELAVRAAIGAGRGRLAREMLIESLLLAVLGGAAGLGLAAGAIKLVLSLSPARLPRFDLIAIDGTSVLFTLVLSVVAGLAFGAIPVLKRGRIRLAEALRAGGRNASAGRDRNITRNTLTIIQVALALVLLIGSGLMIRTFQSMRRVQPGFSEPGTLQTLRIAIPDDAAAGDAKLLILQQTLIDRLAAPSRRLGGRHDQRAADDRFHVAGPDLRQRPRLRRQRHPAAAPLHPDGPWHVPGAGHAARRRPRVRLDRPSPEPPGGPDQRELRARVLGLGGGGDRQAHPRESRTTPGAR